MLACDLDNNTFICGYISCAFKYFVYSLILLLIEYSESLWHCVLYAHQNRIFCIIQFSISTILQWTREITVWYNEIVISYIERIIKSIHNAIMNICPYNKTKNKEREKEWCMFCFSFVNDDWFDWECLKSGNSVKFHSDEETAIYVTLTNAKQYQHFIKSNRFLINICFVNERDIIRKRIQQEF